MTHTPRISIIIPTLREEQFLERTLENLKSVIEASGAALDNAVKVTIYLTDLKNFAELNSIYEEYFSQGKPARACIQAAALPKGATIEIDAIVAVK